MKTALKHATKPYFFVPAMIISLILSLSVWTYVMTYSSAPFTVRNVGLETIDGVEKTEFRPGEIIGVRREICSERNIGVQFFPSLRTTRNAMISLGTGAAYVEQGCAQTVFLFAVPTSLPPGSYTYNNLVRYQANLIGSDEATPYPPLQFEVIGDR